MNKKSIVYKLELDRRFNPHFSPGGKIIAQGFGFTRDFPKEWNNSVYFRLRKISRGFRELARAHQSGEKYGLKKLWVFVEIREGV